MVFIMRYLKNISRWLLFLACLLPLGAQPAAADFNVTGLKPKLDQQVLQLNGSLELALTAKVDEALTKGIPLDITIDISLYRQRGWYIWDQHIANWVIRRRIRYHALSRQYLVHGDDKQPGDVESFIELRQALKYMGTLSDIKLKIDETIANKRQYVVMIRARLDIESLPAPLRPVAYASLDWHLNSGWSKWKVQP